MTWSFGFKRSLRRTSATSSNRLPKYWPLGRVPEGLDVSIQLPKLNVVTINELLSELDSFDIIGALQIDTTLDVAVWTHDVGAVILHCGSSQMEVEDHRSATERSHTRPCSDGSIILPSSGGASAIFCCSCEIFWVWLKWLNLSSLHRISRKAASRGFNSQGACRLRRYANSSAPAGVKVTKVPDSWILSQPRSIASLMPAPYSAGLPRSRNRNGSLIFSMWMRP